MTDAPSEAPPAAPPMPPGFGIPNQTQHAWQPPPGYSYGQPPVQYPTYDGNAAYYAQIPPPGTVGPPPSDGSAPPQPPQNPAAHATGYDYSQYYAGYQQQYNYPNHPQIYDRGYRPPPQQHTAAAWQQPSPGAAAPTVDVKPSSQYGYNNVSYKAVPPPASLVNPQSQRSGVGHQPQRQPPGVIRPNSNRPWIKPQISRQINHSPSFPAVDSNKCSSMVSVALASAASISSGRPVGQKPAYIRVGEPPSAVVPGVSASKSKHPALNPQNWPPAVKSYVERAFKTTPASQRPKLREALRSIIGEAQEKGELWTRRWDTLPTPDLSLPAVAAATLVSEVAAVNSEHSTVKEVQARPQRSAVPGYLSMVPGVHAKISAERVVPPVGRKDGAVRRVRDRTTWEGGSTAEKYNMGRKKRAYGDFRDPSYTSVAYESDSDSDFSQGGPLPGDEALRRRRRSGRFKDGAADGVRSGQGGGGGGGGGKSHAAARRARLSALLDDAGDGEDVDWNSFAIKGTCSELEKSYFRLTSAPHPSTVRPQPVLRSALARLTRLIATGEVNYFYAQDQFKGMRQDCVVQALQGPLAVEVYEAHARAALEYGDVAEYNQCQGQVGVLYADGVASPGGAEMEFLAYRILYQAVHAKHGETLALLKTIRRIGAPEMAALEVQHALKVRSALSHDDYPGFFRLYGSAPALGRALMDLAVPRFRFAALSAFVKAFKPTLPVDYVARVLGFVSTAAEKGAEGSDRCLVKETVAKTVQPLPGCRAVVFEGSYAGTSDAESGREECIAWLSECKAVVIGIGSEAAIDCKASAGQLKVPEEKDAVAHGDINLDIGDFLKTLEAS